MKKFTKFLMVLLSVLLVVSAIPQQSAKAAYAGDERPLLLMINGQYHNYEQPVYKDGRMLVPIRAVSSALGADVKFKSWNQPIAIVLGKNKIQFTLGNKKAYINGKVTQLDVPAQSFDNTAYVPIRLIADGLDVDVSWQESDKILAVESKTISGQKKLTTQSAQASLRKSIGNNLNLAANGVKYLHYYHFIAYKESSEYGIDYLVDKYTGEVYTIKQDRSLNNLTQEQVRKDAELKIQSLTDNLDIATPYLENSDIEIVNGKKYYAFEVLYTRAAGPDYITTLYVDQDKKISYMTDEDFKRIVFIESDFAAFAKEAVEKNSARPSEFHW